MQSLPPVTLVGERVRLEPLDLAHAAGLWAAADGPRGTFVLTHVPASAVEAHRYIEQALALRDAGAALPFAIVDAKENAVVGSTRFGNIERWQWPAGDRRQRPPEQPDAVEIGWTWLAERAQRTGINREAKLLLLSHAFETWQCHRVTLKTDARNLRSRAGIEGIGGKLDGILRAHMPAADGGIRDTALYSIVAGEWPAVKARLVERLR
ncbi:MAG TPA: GNAT family protein [Polyangia bacterium]|nr:GNAT family protein [Polyangia bacterium]